MSPVRYRIDPKTGEVVSYPTPSRARAAVSSFAFWLVVAYFAIGAVVLAGVIENRSRISDVQHVLDQTCTAGNETRAALRVVFRRLEDGIEKGPNESLVRARASRLFFNAALGPYGERSKHGPLADHPC